MNSLATEYLEFLNVKKEKSHLSCNNNSFNLYFSVNVYITLQNFFILTIENKYVQHFLLNERKQWITKLKIDMALTFGGYIGVHAACGAGMFIITGIILGLCARYAHSIYRFFMMRMLGVELEYDTNPNSLKYLTIKVDQMQVKYERILRTLVVLWFIGTATLTLALMVLYEGCILGSAGVYIGDYCPSDPMTCFASNYNGSDTGTFECVPGNMTVFPGTTDKAWCYGWIVKRQTVSSVINQIGVCGGILTVVGTLFAFTFRVGQGKDWQPHIALILCLLTSLAFPTMGAMAGVFHISFSVLAYLVVIEVGLIFFAAYIFELDESKSKDTTSTPVPVQITRVST
jgi:hypothetical protein